MKFLATTLAIGALSVSLGTALAGEKATATMTGPDGAAMGTVTLTQGPDGVLVSAALSGLTPGSHGFHIHAVGSCAPDFKAAGGHYNPAGSGHGLLHAGGHHAGDLPNVVAGADGNASADVFTPNVTLAKGASNSVFDADGSSVIVHAKPDTYGENAGAGARVSCGVITAN